MSEKAHRNKRRNVRQEKRGIVETGRMSGKYQLGLLHKAGNYEKIKRELVKRGISLVHEGEMLTYPKMKESIKIHEQKRVGNVEGYNDLFFESLSGEVFIETRKRG